MPVLTPVQVEDLLEDVDRYTVAAYWVETLERFTWQVMASGARQAEDLAHQEARTRGGHLAVCGVFGGWHDALDTFYATWVDPDATTQEEVDRKRGQLGWEPGLITPTEVTDAAEDSVLIRSATRAALIVGAVSLLLGVLFGMLLSAVA